MLNKNDSSEAWHGTPLQGVSEKRITKVEAKDFLEAWDRHQWAGYPLEVRHGLLENPPCIDVFPARNLHL